jgi:hypothetical protein
MARRAVVPALAAIVALTLAAGSTSERPTESRHRGFRACVMVAALDGFGGPRGPSWTREDVLADPQVAKRVSELFYGVVRNSFPGGQTDLDEAFLGCADAMIGGWPPDVPVSRP